MAKKIVAVVGEYQNQQGEQKAEFCEIGVVNVSQNGKEYVLLDPTVNIAGVLAKQNALAMKKGEQVRDMVMCSLLERDNQGQQAPQQQGYGQPQSPQQGYAQQQPPVQPAPQQAYAQPPQNGNYGGHRG